MRGRDQQRAQQFISELHSFHANERPLPGIQTLANESAFVEQLLESIHRVEYISVIYERDVSPGRADPISPLFDPIKAAIYHDRLGHHDEACWLAFLSVHFGRHKQDGWRLCADVYRGPNQNFWDWASLSEDPQQFREWLSSNRMHLDGRRFGNHRKYETLDTSSPNGTAAVFSSYVNWVGEARSHQTMIENCRVAVGSDPGCVFDFLYKSMDAVARFGRTARFDYLTMLGKLRLAPVKPAIPYMKGATGPLSGARLLLDGSGNSSLRWQDADTIVVELGDALGVGMQVLEDALCNWQKSPAEFKPFRS